MSSPPQNLFEISTFYHIFIIVFTVDEVRYISNKYQPPNNLVKSQYFYTTNFIPLLHFEIKNGAFQREHPLREDGNAVQRVYDKKFSNQGQSNIGEAVVTLFGNLLRDILIHVAGNK